MKNSSGRMFVFLMAMAMAMAGCATTIAYTPNPATAVAPEKQIEDALNFSTFPAAKLEITDTHMKAIQIIYGVAVTTVIRFSNIAAMNLQSVSGGPAKYRVTVENTSGDLPFLLWSNDLDTAKRFIDALAALHARAPKQ